MNKYFAIGYLGDNPESLPKGCKLSVCVQTWNGKENKNLWLRVFVFGQAAQNCLQYLEKGRRIALSGRLDLSQGGNLIIITDDVEFL